MKAVMTVEPGRVAVVDIPIPRPGPGQILVKVIAAAQNPVDWKFVNFLSKPGVIVGCDFVGVVHEIGAGVPEGLRSIGEKVAGFVQGGANADDGSFAEYLVSDAQLVISIPDHISDTGAAGFGIALFTACQTLYQTHKFPLFPSPEEISTPKPLLVWSGATAVGQYVIKLAKILNFDVIATASPKNHALLARIGADLVLDYSDPDVVHKVREYTKGKLVHAVDCISEFDSPAKVAACIGEDGGHVARLLRYDTEGLRTDVEQTLSLVFTMLGKPIVLPMSVPPIPEHHANGVEYALYLSQILKAGKLEPNPVLLFPRGLEGVQEGLDYMKLGNVSGAKVTYRIADTPGLCPGRRGHTAAASGPSN